MNFKALASQKIRKMMKEGEIKGADNSNIQPASLDLTLTGEAYRMRWTFLPQSGEKIEDIIKIGSLYPFDLSHPLEPGAVYLIKLKEGVNLPKNVFALTNNKSSTGRLNLETRVIADGVPRFDRLPLGHKGSLWIQVRSKSFFIKLNAGDKLNQIRFFEISGKGERENASIKDIYLKHKLFYDREKNFIPADKIMAEDHDNSLIMSIDLAPDAGIVGYKAVHTGEVLDFSKKNHHGPERFFEPIKSPHDGRLTLRCGEFYILSTKEFIRVPPEYSVEMVAYDIGSGEFRSHYAGFFDPGFGYGMKGEVFGTPAVLEVKPYDNNFSLRDGQPICKMVFVENSEMPDLVYGVGDLGSHYQKQRGAFLSKHFKK